MKLYFKFQELTEEVGKYFSKGQDNVPLIDTYGHLWFLWGKPMLRTDDVKYILKRLDNGIKI